jgi:hypothetical protein
VSSPFPQEPSANVGGRSVYASSMRVPRRTGEEVVPMNRGVIGTIIGILVIIILVIVILQLT